MKCDELKYERLGDAFNDYPDSTLVIRKQFVDAAIAELKAENERLNRELEHVKNGDCINTCDVVEKHVKEDIKAKRALWLARAERAKTEYNHWILIWHCELSNHLFFINKTRYKNRAKVDRLHYPWEWRDIWYEVERKCRAKAEEFK